MQSMSLHVWKSLKYRQSSVCCQVHMAVLERLAKAQDTTILVIFSNPEIELTMKKTAKYMVLVAASAIGFTACQKNIQEDVHVNEDTVVVSFVAQSANTKTTVDTSGDTPVFAWDESETFAVLEQTDALAKATSVTYEKDDAGKAKIDAEFASNTGKSEYKYVTVYPEAAYMEAESITDATLCLPAEQTMAEESYDPSADLMVSEVVTTDVQPTEAQMVRFTRLAAVVKMTLKNFQLADGDNVQSVTFAADGKALAGNIVADLADPHAFTAGTETSSSVTVATTSATDVFFTVLPTTLEAGDAYTVTVVTDKKLYIKQGTIGEGKTLEFQAGMVNNLGADMTGIVPSDKWVLVKDASTLKSGDVVAIAAKDYDKALSTKLYSNASETSTSVRRDATDISKYQEYLIANSDVQQFVLVPGVANGTFAFYDEAREKFLVSSNKTSRYLINQAYVDANASFAISIDAENGDATVKNTEGDYIDNMIRYYNSSKYFYSGTSANQAVCVYKLAGATCTIPVVAANVTVPAEDESVVIAEEGAATPTAMDDIVFNYVGDWTISATASETWLTPVYADGVLTYTAEANTGEKRNATVTITATLEGQEDLTWTFNVLQKGVPQEITIAELRTKTKDESTVYKVTGQVKTVPSSSTGNWEIVDENGNVAKIAYLKTDGGSYAKDAVNIKVGDVMTVTTIVTGTNGTYACGKSAYPSIYKGHFTVEATASGSVGYEGGDVTISISVMKYGHIVAPTAISDNSNVATDGNPISAYSFTDNGNGTATAVVNFSENTTGGSRKVDLNFSAGSPLAVSTTVSVMQDVNPALKTGWWLVTDVAELSAGDKIIIAATGLDYAISTATNTNNRKSTAITKNGGALEDVSSSVQQYALEIDDNGFYAFKGTLGTDANKYIYAASSSSNYMKVSSTLDNNGKWTISIESDGAATIEAQGDNTRNKMQYNNKSTSSPAFYCTDGSFGAVCLYKLYE